MRCASVLVLSAALAYGQNSTSDGECRWSWKDMRCAPHPRCRFQVTKGSPFCRVVPSVPEPEKRQAAQVPPQTEQYTIDLDSVNIALQNQSATDIVKWAADTFKDGLVLQSSFGITAAVMLHVVVSVVPDIPVIVVDTEYFPPETYQFIEQLKEQLNLNLKVYKGLMSPTDMEAEYGKLWEMHSEWAHELYGKIRKVEPMERGLNELNATAILTGLRSDQTDFRKSLNIVNPQGSRYKVCPILHWSQSMVNNYIREHNLSFHPLKEKGYETVGDAHSSRPVTAFDMNVRDTRFAGVATECGLHTQMFGGQQQSKATVGSI